MTQQLPSPEGASAPDFSEGRAPNFHLRVLDQMPAPLVVVNGMGQVTYINAAMLALGGWSDYSGLGRHIVDFLHPDDVDWIAEAFLSLVAESSEADPGERGPMASIHLRFIAGDGSVIPLEVTASGAMTDPDIEGVIYDIRPARHHDVLNNVLAGVASGANVEELLLLVAQLIAMPPLDLEAAILEPTIDGQFTVVASTCESLAGALASNAAHVPWDIAESEPSLSPVEDLPADMSESLSSAGFADCWHVSVETSVTDQNYRIVAVSRVQHRPAPGVIDRLNQARELAGVVLLRAHSDQLLRHAAEHDGLTGLANRSVFRQHLANMLDARANGTAESFSVLFIDLDGFKAINDLHGHAAGDAVLQVVAERLQHAVRSEDVVARLGGDEFGVLLRADSRHDGAAVDPEPVAQRMLQSIGQPIQLDHDEVRLTASIGVATPAGDSDVDAVLGRADAHMYTAKRSGGDQAIGDDAPAAETA